jgi:hypothetical protein
MKKTLLAAAAVVMVVGGSLAAANAANVYIGPGGVDVAPSRHYYDYEGDNCRTIITHHTNRWGNEVTVRRRVCD